MRTYTIGFTKKSAKKFFGLIEGNNVSKVIDVRLNNVSQLAGFAKKDDLEFFLKELCHADYIHIPDLTPTKSILDDYKKKIISWETYEEKFIEIMIQRNIERSISRSLLDQGCLLCSEHDPHHCHRRLVVEYLNKHWNTELEIIHLV